MHQARKEASGSQIIHERNPEIFNIFLPMCYSVAFLEKKTEKLATRYQGILPPNWKPQLSSDYDPGDLPTHYFISGFSHPLMPVITAAGIKMITWGLVPHWAKNRETAERIRKGTLNAVGETVFEKPSYRSSIRARRCILAISGFFEWRAFNNKKYPYYIYPKNDTMFSLACIYDHWTDKQTGELFDGFSILTTPANRMMASIHNQKERMPLILPRQVEQQWIHHDTSPDVVRSLIRPYSDNQMQAHSVSRDLNYAKNNRDRPEAIQPASYPELPPLNN